ncbi:MAG TPA: NFACT family protein [Nitrospiraceae bacterium]|nr:NFACT family protein [Nitrospiraceae bacterium]
MALSAREITAVLEEVAPVLTGGWIQKIHQPAALTIVLEIRTPGLTHRLLISCFPETARLHLITASRQNPVSPPPFCQFLRAHLQGAHIDAITQIQDDRIVRIDLTTKAGTRALVAELTGKTANLFVLDGDERLVRELKGSRDRQGQPYKPPALAPHSRRIPSSISVAHSVSDARFPLSAAIEATYQDRDAAASLDEARAAKLGTLKKSIKKLQRRIDAWHDDLTKAAKYRTYGRYGELLKANLNLIKRGQREVTVVDYFEDSLPSLTIPLDPTKTPQGNMDDYFRKHRKYLASERELHPRIEAGRAELAAMHRELDTIKLGTWRPPAILSAGRSKGRGPADNRTKPGLQTRRGPFRRFTSADGLPIFVGRNARENDDLTFRFASSDDLWLHARGVPGSHVVVRLAKGQDIPQETLRDAATLALLYSDFKKSGKGDVIYTRRKWVRKAKGHSAGAVTVTHDQSLVVTLDRVRLERLKTDSG